MATSQPVNPAANTLLTRELDDRYLDLVDSQLAAITKRTQSGAVGKRLKELVNEAKRLASNNELLKPNNAVYKALQSDLKDAMRVNRQLVDNAGDGMQAGGIEAADKLARTFSALWVKPKDKDKAADKLAKLKRPTDKALQSAINYTESDAWQESLSKYTAYPSAVVNSIVVSGFAAGKSPESVVSQLAQTVGSLPTTAANTLLRTLFLNSYRKATSETYQNNSDIIEYAVRVAALDSRVCLACALLHGTIIPIDEPVADHFNGRCTSVVKITGIPLNIPSGTDWFNALDAAQQIAIMGNAAYAAWQAGAVTLEDFVNEHTDDLFGDMVSVNSLVAILGELASQYYGAGVP